MVPVSYHKVSYEAVQIAEVPANVAAEVKKR